MRGSPMLQMQLLIFAQELRNFAGKHVKIIPGENTVCSLPVYG